MARQAMQEEEDVQDESIVQEEEVETGHLPIIKLEVQMHTLFWRPILSVGMWYQCYGCQETC